MADNEKLDRHTDPSGLVESARAASDGRPFLGDVAAVDKILRAYAGEVFSRYDEVTQGVLTPSDAADADRAACLKLGAIFCGEDPAYAPVRGWSGPQLAEHLRSRMERELQLGEGDTETVAQAFGVFTHHLYDLLREVSAGSPEGEVQEVLLGHLHSFRMALMGVVGND